MLPLLVLHMLPRRVTLSVMELSMVEAHLVQDEWTSAERYLLMSDWLRRWLLMSDWLRRLYRTPELLSRIRHRNGEFVWPTCGSSVTIRDISKNAQNTTLDTNSNPKPDPDPTHINFVLEKSRGGVVEKIRRPHKKSWYFFSRILYFMLDSHSHVRWWLLDWLRVRVSWSRVVHSNDLQP